MKRLNVFLAFLAVCLFTHAYEERAMLEKVATLEQVREALVMNQDWIPYPKAYADRAGWTDFFGGTKEEIIRNGEKYLGYEWKVMKTSYYLAFERDGNRVKMETPLFENNRAFSSLFAAEMAEGKGRFMDDIIDGVVFYCEMTSWALSAHLKGLSRLGRSIPYEQENVVELFQGNISQMLSWTYYYLRGEMDKVSPTIAKRLRNELQKRELDAYMARDDYWWMGWNVPKGQPVNNWNPWCNYNAITCFMLLENDRDKLAKAVYKTMLSVDKYLNWVTADGACEEGPSYWGAANGMLLDYLDGLQKITGGKVSLFDQKLIKDLGEYIVYSNVGNGWAVNFADASARSGGDPLLIYRYGVAVDSEMMKSFAADVKSRTTMKFTDWTTPSRTFEAVRHLKSLNREEGGFTAPAGIWYPDTEFFYKSMDNRFLAAKGGHNNESHNHNDVGSFAYYVNTIPVLIDAGVGVYSAKTFSKERYTIWTMQSQYHNLPSINGVMEHEGANYRSANVKADSKKGFFSLDIAGAYPAEAKVKTWNRSYQLHKSGLRIQDKFELEEVVAPNVVNFMTWGKVDITTPGQVKIETQGQQVVLTYDPQQFTVEKETVPLNDRNLSAVWGKEIYRIILTAKHQSLKGNYRFDVTKG